MLSNNSLVGLWIVSGISGIGINSYSLATTGLKTNDFSVSTLDSNSLSNQESEPSKKTEQNKIVSQKEEVENPVIKVKTSSPQQPTETLKESIKENSKDIKSKEEMPTQKPEEVKDEVPQKKDSGKDRKEQKSEKKKQKKKPKKSAKSPEKNKEQNSVSKKEISNSKDIDTSSPKSSQSSSEKNHGIIKDSVSSTTKNFVGIFVSLLKKIIK